MLRLVCFLMLLVAAYPRAAQAELPTKPENVLPYLAEVYKAKDIKGYSDLLTTDFRFVMEDNGAGWDKASDVKGTKALFGAASPKLSFPAEVSVKPGSQPGTWIIDDVALALDVTQNKDGKIWHVENTCSFLIRNENGTMRIAEWRQRATE